MAHGKNAATGPCSLGCNGKPAWDASRLKPGPGFFMDTGERGAGVGGAEKSEAGTTMPRWKVICGEQRQRRRHVGAQPRYAAGT